MGSHGALGKGGGGGRLKGNPGMVEPGGAAEVESADVLGSLVPEGEEEQNK